MPDYPTDERRGSVGEPERPCAFVNKNSGERGSVAFMIEQLKKRFGEDNVFDLFPEKGQPPAIEEAKAFVAQRKPDLLIVAGGDGTVSLGLDIVDAVRADGKIDDTTAPIAVIPMGTGNDLSRSLGFGGGYKKPPFKAEEHFEKLLKRLFTAHECKIDRFSLKATLIEGSGAPADNERHQPNATPLAADAKKKKKEQQQQKTPNKDQKSSEGSTTSPSADKEKETPQALHKVFTNYFSIGFDAKVAKQFGDFRDNNPQMCNSRVVNKMWYGCFGCNALCSSSVIPKAQLSLKMDQKSTTVPSNTKAIVVANMITYAGGNVLWSDPHHRYKSPAVDDGKVEVIALEGVWHMVGIGTHARSGKKMGQGASIVLYAPANFTMQYDGEPIAPMGTAEQTVKIAIEFKSQSLGMVLNKSAENENEDDSGEGAANPTPLHNEEQQQEAGEEENQ